MRRRATRQTQFAELEAKRWQAPWRRHNTTSKPHASYVYVRSPAFFELSTGSAGIAHWLAALPLPEKSSLSGSIISRAKIIRIALSRHRLKFSFTRSIFPMIDAPETPLRLSSWHALLVPCPGHRIMPSTNATADPRAFCTPRSRHGVISLRTASVVF